MSKPQKTRAQLEAELKFVRQSNIALSVSSIFNTIVKSGSYAAIAYFCSDIAKSFSGKVTITDINIGVMANIASKASASINTLIVLVSLLFGFSGMLYGRSRHNLLQFYIENNADRNTQHEISKDPKRTSSGLTKKGKIQKEDT